MVKPPGFNAFGIFIRGDSTLGAERLERFVPTGCRMISLREGLLAWRYSAAFRRFICSRDEEGMWSSKNHMWVSGSGLTEDGGFKIEVDGSIVPASQKLYDRLPSRMKVAFRKGSGNVELIGGKIGRRIHLSVETDRFEGTDMNDCCWLAYTKGI